MEGQETERIPEVLAQFPTLAHLDHRGNVNSDSNSTDGIEKFPGVLGQCRKLVHLNLNSNWRGAVWALRQHSWKTL
jgi:hypothetical protein